MNDDNANQVEVGEGPKAADTILQRIVRAREAQAPEVLAPSDIESAERLLDDLELGDESDFEVIEHLDELDACTEDTAKAKAKARVAATLAAYAAAKIKASVAQELTPALIEQTCGTDGPNTATPAVQVVAVAKKAEQTDIENLEPVLGDLELGADETTGEVIEDMGELDAASEDAPINEINREKAEPAATKQVDGAEIGNGELAALDQAHKEPKLRELMRAARVKYSAGVEVAKDDDPLAKDKKKIANTFKKVGRTLADLPPDWDKLPRITKIPLERSRQSEFYRVFREGEEEMREAERLRELEKRGRPANYDLLPWDERDRIDDNIRQRRHRDKKRKPPSKPTSAPLPVANADILRPKARHGISRSLDIWTRGGSSPLARQLRKPEQQRALIRAAAAYAWYFDRHGKPPARSVLAKMLRSTEDQARRKLDVLKSLYAPGGPWAGA